MRITGFGLIVVVLVGSAMLARLTAATRSSPSPHAATTSAMVQTAALQH